MSSSIELRYIYDVVKKLDLAAFIEREAGVKFGRLGGRMTCRCPMPNHRDSEPSFGVTRLPDGIWVFTCFGCGSGGTIIDFCLDFWSLDTVSQAIELISGKMDLGDSEEMIRNALQNIKVTANEELQLERQHIQAASICNALLRDFADRNEIRDWVFSQYRAMNAMLENNNLVGIYDVASMATRILRTGGLGQHVG